MLYGAFYSVAMFKLLSEVSIFSLCIYHHLFKLIFSQKQRRAVLKRERRKRKRQALAKIREAGNLYFDYSCVGVYYIMQT